MNAKDFNALLKAINSKSAFKEGFKGGAIGGALVALGYDILKNAIKNASANICNKHSRTKPTDQTKSETILKQLSIEQKKKLISALQKDIEKESAIEVDYAEVKTEQKI